MITNTLIIPNIRSIPELLDESGNLIMDYNRILPMPAGLRMDVCSSDYHDILWFLTEYGSIFVCDLPKLTAELIEKMLGTINPDAILRTFDLMREKMEQMPEPVQKLSYEKGRSLVDNYLKYGYMTWYNWREQYWGTVWNAENSRPGTEKDSLVFETDNDIPLPILLKLARKHPEVNMMLTYDSNTVLGSGKINITDLARFPWK